MDFKVRKCAEDLKDRDLLAKLSAGDMVAIDAFYHTKCLIQLYRRAEMVQTSSATNSDDTLHALCFAEIVSYIESYREDTDTAPVFSMPQLSKLYTARLQDLGVENCEVHSTRLRQKLLAAIPDLVPTLQGREFVLVFDKDIGDAIRQVCSHDSELLALAKAAQLIRRELFQSNNSFNGTFSSECQDRAVPFLLKAFVSMVLNGPGAVEESKSRLPQAQAVLTISQLLAFNSKKSSKITQLTRHRTERETPLSVYLSLKVHSETRKKGLVDVLHKLGLGISYKRVMSISNDIANSVCKKFEADGVVPPKMNAHMFTIGAVDNIDHNPSSTTAKDSFHGTSISLMQEVSNEPDTCRHFTPLIDKTVQGKGIIAQLPVS